MVTRTLLVFLALVPLVPAAGPQPTEDRMTDGMNQFAGDLYARMARGEENLVFSPLSIFTALSIALAGARGDTGREIAAVLHQPYPNSQYASALSAGVDRLAASANTRGTELLNAGALWVDRGFPIQADFRQTMQNFYRAPLLPLDFSKNPESARREINQWTADRTKGKIVELFGPGAFDHSTRLVLSSAIYFNGKWQLAFRPQNTETAPFRLNGGGTVDARFMNQSGRFGYRETPSIQILEMKYADDALALDILLPKSPGQFGQMESSLNPGNLAAWFRDLHTRQVEVSVPKFRTESEFSLRGALESLGMASAFNSSADFSGIDDRRDLALSQVRHKAFVDVAEEGTEAAAATGVGVALISAVVPQQPPVVFRADHPFIFLVRDRRSGVIVFAGQVVRPVK